MNNIWYVYRHRRLDKNEIFYVGIGKTLKFKRAFSKASRSEFWHNIINKSEYSVEILKENLSWEDAQELEAFLISLYGRSDINLGNLVNHTDGYGGINNPSKEIREKMSTGRKGKTSIWLGKTLPEITKKLMKENHTDFSGSKNPRARKVKDVRSGKIYNCIKDLSNELGVNHKTLSSKLNKIKGYKPEPYYELC